MFQFILSINLSNKWYYLYLQTYIISNMQILVIINQITQYKLN